MVVGQVGLVGLYSPCPILSFPVRYSVVTFSWQRTWEQCEPIVTEVFKLSKYFAASWLVRGGWQRMYPTSCSEDHARSSLCAQLQGLNVSTPRLQFSTRWRRSGCQNIWKPACQSNLVSWCQLHVLAWCNCLAHDVRLFKEIHAPDISSPQVFYDIIDRSSISKRDVGTWVDFTIAWQPLRCSQPQTSNWVIHGDRTSCCVSHWTSVGYAMTLQIVANPTAYMKAMMVATPVPITEMMSLQPVSGLVAPAVDHMPLLFFRKITEYHWSISHSFKAFAQMLLLMLWLHMTAMIDLFLHECSVQNL